MSTPVEVTPAIVLTKDCLEPDNRPDLLTRHSDSDSSSYYSTISESTSLSRCRTNSDDSCRTSKWKLKFFSVESLAPSHIEKGDRSIKSESSSKNCKHVFDRRHYEADKKVGRSQISISCPEFRQKFISKKRFFTKLRSSISATMEAAGNRDSISSRGGARPKVKSLSIKKRVAKMSFNKKKTGEESSDIDHDSISPSEFSKEKETIFSEIPSEMVPKKKFGSLKRLKKKLTPSSAASATEDNKEQEISSKEPEQKFSLQLDSSNEKSDTVQAENQVRSVDEVAATPQSTISSDKEESQDRTEETAKDISLEPDMENKTKVSKAVIVLGMREPVSGALVKEKEKIPDQTKRNLTLDLKSKQTDPPQTKSIAQEIDEVEKQTKIKSSLISAVPGNIETDLATNENVISPEKHEHLYKILVIGELGAGKTSIIKRFVHQFFSQHYRATIGVDFALKVINWDKNTVVRLQLWDIAGQERFGNMTRVYYKEAVGAFIVFDVTRSQTFDAVVKWKNDLDTKVTLPDGSSIPTVLLANKCDQPKEGVANNPARMDDFCRERSFAGWFETSAKEDINIDEAAKFLVSKILKNEKNGLMTDDVFDKDKFSIDNGSASSSQNKEKCSC